MPKVARKSGKKTTRLTGTRRTKYTLGKHGFKQKEQQRLSKLFDMIVSGHTHESEHAVGFEVINRSSGLKRDGKGRSGYLEKIAPAYQEVYGLHREHIGTGTNKGDWRTNKAAKFQAGFDSQSYRDAQRTAIEAEDISTAIQLNQLGYAFLDKSFVDPTALKAANDSYDAMVDNLQDFTYADGDKDVKFQVSAKDRAEMYLARRAMLTGRFPTVEEENEARKRYGLELIKEKEEDDEDQAMDIENVVQQKSNKQDSDKALIDDEEENDNEDLQDGDDMVDI